MLTLSAGRYAVRLSRAPDDVLAAQRLRHMAFVARRGGAGRAGGVDADALDARCQHGLIRDEATGDLVGCFRLLFLPDGAAISQSYSAQFYDLSGLAAVAGPLAEIGRFCVRPGLRDPDILRSAWAALTRLVDERGVTMLIGCSSFEGAKVAAHLDALALLRDRHLAPPAWRPGLRAAEAVGFDEALRGVRADMNNGLRSMPPLLRSYLAMGGRVSDHAVIDRDLDTIHVFTGVEIAAIPAQRARLLRTLAG